MMRGLFVTGTDTEVGKTRVAAALLHVLAASPGAPRVAGYKPVAAGVDAQGRNDDVRALQAASSIPLSASEVCPALLPEPCAPHIAAARVGRRIALDELVQGAHALIARADALVVEGVGGFCVPFDDQHDSADLAQRLALPVVLVVGLCLGCLSHALLTAEAVARRGLRLAGWVGNRIDPAMPCVEDNIETLARRLWAGWRAPCLGVVPHLRHPDPASVAAHLDADAIYRLLPPADSNPPTHSLETTSCSQKS